MNSNELQALRLRILDGDADDHLGSISEWVKMRKTYLSQQRYENNVSGVKPGDKVRFSSSIRPKYLIGLTATVEKINSKSIVVSCPVDSSYGRFSGHSKIRCPKSLIEGVV